MVPCCPFFGVRVSVTFHHMFVHIISSSVSFADRMRVGTFWKRVARSVDHSSLCFLTSCKFNYFPFWL